MLIRSLLLSLGLVMSFTAIPTRIEAQDYPTREIKLVVGFPAGGSTDIQARILADKLSSALGQRVLVENRSGAAGAAATRSVVKGEKDGYTLSFHGTDLPINVQGMKEPGYSLDDFTIIGAFAYSPMVLITNTQSSKATSLKEFIAYAKANPGKLSYATFGPQSLANLAANRFKELAGIDWREVPYRGAPQVVQDMLNGNVDAYFGLTTVGSQLNGQPNVTLFGVADKQRNVRLPNVPTFAEVGFPQFVELSTTGLWVVAGTPKPIVDKLRKALADVKKMDDVKALLGKSGNSILEMTPEEYEKDTRTSSTRFGAEFKKLGIRLE